MGSYDKQEFNFYGVGYKYAVKGKTATANWVELKTDLLDDRSSLAVYNNGSDVFIGPSGTAQADMFVLPSGQTLSLDLRDKDETGTELAIHASGATVDVRIMEIL